MAELAEVGLSKLRASKIHQISELSAGLKGWTICAKVQKKEAVKEWKEGTSSARLLRLWLTDESGCLPVNCFTYQVDQFNMLMQEGQFYYVQGGNLDIRKDGHRRIPLELVFTSDTHVTPRQEKPAVSMVDHFDENDLALVIGNEEKSAGDKPPSHSSLAKSITLIWQLCFKPKTWTIRVKVVEKGPIAFGLHGSFFAMWLKDSSGVLKAISCGKSVVKHYSKVVENEYYLVSGGVLKSANSRLRRTNMIELLLTDNSHFVSCLEFDIKEKDHLEEAVSPALLVPAEAAINEDLLPGISAPTVFFGEFRQMANRFSGSIPALQILLPGIVKRFTQGTHNITQMEMVFLWRLMECGSLASVWYNPSQTGRRIYRIIYEQEWRPLDILRFATFLSQYDAHESLVKNAVLPHNYRLREYYTFRRLDYVVAWITPFAVSHREKTYLQICLHIGLPNMANRVFTKGTIDKHYWNFREEFSSNLREKAFFERKMAAQRRGIEVCEHRLQCPYCPEERIVTAVGQMIGSSHLRDHVAKEHFEDWKKDFFRTCGNCAQPVEVFHQSTDIQNIRHLNRCPNARCPLIVPKSGWDILIVPDGFEEKTWTVVVDYSENPASPGVAFVENRREAAVTIGLDNNNQEVLSIQLLSLI